MGVLTPDERAKYARLAALTSWGTTPDRSARTAPARKALLDRFEKQVPAEVTDPATRAAAAENLRKAHYLRMALASAKARKAKATRRPTVVPSEATATFLSLAATVRFGAVMLQARRLRQWSQGRLGDELHERYDIRVQAMTISEIERGRRRIRRDVANAVADLLGVDLPAEAR